MESTIDHIIDKFSVQAILAIILTATSCIIWIQGRTVPQDLILLNGIVAAFYFGNKLGEKKATDAINPPSLPDGQ